MNAADATTEWVRSSLQGASLVVCCGAGGVGKTSSAAALALSAAAYGRRVVVLTIDPAKRLAQALGMTGLGNDAVAVALPDDMAGAGGSLHALMLDPKATFDGMVQSTIRQETIQRALQSNHVYRLLTQAFHGMQEYMAVEKLFALLGDPRFDLVVLDTPPTSNVLTFFEAPARMAQFFDRRVVKWFLPSHEQSRLARLLSGQSAAMLLLQKVAGEDFARDLQEFFMLLGAMADALAQRAAQLDRVLGLPSTRYVVVTGAEQSRVDETHALVGQLARRAYRPSAVLVNRVTPEALASEQALSTSDARLTTLLAKLEARRAALVKRVASEQAQISRLKQLVGATLVHVVPRLEVQLDSIGGIAQLARSMG